MTDKTTASSASPSQRLMSLDALRGFDMFWIIGAEPLVEALRKLHDTSATRLLSEQLEHVEWAGFHFEDLIFPLFVFMVGVAMVYSLTRTITQDGKLGAVKRILRRSVLLFVVGIIYSGGVSNSWPDLRVSGVLNRIAIAYCFAGLLFCFFKPRALVAIAASLLLGYWALLALTPIRDIRLEKESLAQRAEQMGDAKAAELLKGPGNFSAVKDSPAWAAAEKVFYATTNRVTGKYDQGYNVVDHFDFQYMPGRRYDVFFDPEGWLSMIPAVVTCLLGVFAGLLLTNASVDDRRKVIYLLAAGFVAVALGWLWNLQFPVIKKIWTSSYVLVAGGYSALLLGTFYLVVDVWKLQMWCQPFVWIGMNPITLYLTSNFLGGYTSLARRLAGGDVRAWFNNHVAQGAGDLLVAGVALGLVFWLANLLYRKKVFLRF